MAPDNLLYKVLPARSAALNDKLFLADEAVRGLLVTLDFLGQFGRIRGITPRLSGDETRQAMTPDVDRRAAVSSSHLTPRWRKQDSNPGSHLKGLPAGLHVFDSLSPEHCPGAAGRSWDHAPNEVGPRVGIFFPPARSPVRTWTFDANLVARLPDADRRKTVPPIAQLLRPSKRRVSAAAPRASALPGPTKSRRRCR